MIDPKLTTTLVRIGQLCPAKDYDRTNKAFEQLAEAKRRLATMASSNADDYRWFKNAAQQACRSLDIQPDELEWE